MQASEKMYICNATEAGESVFGICLGAQLIANALGAGAYQNSAKEIGWFPVQGGVSNENLTFSISSSIGVFRWHGETFDLPSETTLIARSQGCENQ